MRFHLRQDWCQHKEQAARHLTLATTTCLSHPKFLPLSRVLLYIYDVYLMWSLFGDIWGLLGIATTISVSHANIILWQTQNFKNNIYIRFGSAKCGSFNSNHFYCFSKEEKKKEITKVGDDVTTSIGDLNNILHQWKLSCTTGNIHENLPLW